MMMMMYLEYDGDYMYGLRGDMLLTYSVQMLVENAGPVVGVEGRRCDE